MTPVTEPDNRQLAHDMLERFGSRVEAKRALLDELVENNEHGVAFEILAGMLADDDRSMSQDDLDFLRELGLRWETERDPVPWTRLEAKVEQRADPT
jgi:hypothetical protein